jgi:hypothetical protein
MAHKSLSGLKSASKSIKKTDFIAKIGSFDTDTDTDPDSIKIRIAGAVRGNLTSLCNWFKGECNLHRSWPNCFVVSSGYGLQDSLTKKGEPT